MSDESLTSFSRRGLLLGAGAAAGALAVPSLPTLPATAAEPTAATAAEPTAEPAAAAEPFVAYHGVTGAGHQQRFNQLSARGYRMISLSVYGSPPRYAAVWVRRTGPAWAAAHGLTAAQYQARVDQLAAQGYRPVIVTATGPRSAPVFAAVFERVTGSWMARHGLVDGAQDTVGTLAHANRLARDNKLIPVSLAVYGTGAGDRTYAAAWLPNPGNTKWQAHDMGSAAGYQARFDGYVQVPMRPLVVDANDGHRYAAIFTDDSVGPWVARHNMTGAQYQAVFNAQVAAGRMPITVQGSGLGSGIRYAAVFAERSRPLARQWRQVNAVGGAHAGVHAVMRDFLRQHGVRAGTLAVRRNGVLRLAAGYTWAEPGYTITQPGSMLRIASVSKAFTCAAIQALVTDHGFDLDTEVFPYLGINAVALPAQTKDARIDTVTVRQLVNHTGGWVRGVTGMDPVFAGRSIALALGLPGRVTKRDVARYMYGEPLQYDPGDSTAYDGDARYSNFGYLLLGLVVERHRGIPFGTYVRQRVMTPLGMQNQVFTGATLRSGRRAGELSYDAAAIGSSAWSPQSDAFVPSAYGTFLVAEMDSGGGLIASAPAVTAFINRNAVWGMGGRAAGSARSGSMPGTRSLAVSRTDGIDWAYILNTRDVPADADANGRNNYDRLSDDLNAAITASGV